MNPIHMSYAHQNESHCYPHFSPPSQSLHFGIKPQMIRAAGAEKSPQSSMGQFLGPLGGEYMGPMGFCLWDKLMYDTVFNIGSNWYIYIYIYIWV